MNLVIRAIALGCLILVWGGIAVAQTTTTPRTKTEKTQQASRPSTSPRVTTAPPRSVERSTASDRSTGGNTSTGSNRPATSSPAPSTGSAAASQGMAPRLMPSQTNLRTQSLPRPSASGSARTDAAAKGSAKPNKKVAPLKPVEKVNVNWMTLEQALERCKVEKRKIFIDVYTDWCGWCKHMDSTTFVNPAVAKYLNDHYYPVKFNAEQTQDIQFKDKVYKFKKNGSRGYHELAAFWLNNRLSFPTTVFLDENQNLIQPLPGYQDGTKMEAIINYFGTDSHKKTPWETYEKNFVSPQR